MLNKWEATSPLVSVVIPCLNEESHILACLNSVFEQTYPAESIEIIVVDGGSSDKTLTIVDEVARKRGVRLVHNPHRIQSAGCNHAIFRSQGEFIIRLDAHALYQRDYIAQCVRTLLATGAENVGGAMRPVAKTFFQRALAAALDSPLGIGGASYRQAEREGWVDTVWPGAFRRRVFETVGLYDDRAITNEDGDLNFRIARSGGGVYQSRDIVAYYLPRDRWQALVRQYFRYGIGRARTSIKHRRLHTLRPLAPFAIVFLAAILGACSFFSHGAALLLLGLAAVYTCFVAGEAIRIGTRHDIVLAPLMGIIFPTIHFAHGIGFACGLVRYGLHHDWDPEPRRLPPRTTSTVERIQ